MLFPILQRKEAPGPIIAMAYFNPEHPSGGQYVLITFDYSALEYRCVVTDFNGTVLSRLDAVGDLGVLAPYQIAAITNGPYKGAFALVDLAQYEMTVFRLDND